jgi:RNA polymerase sigma-70 factor (ECF subfamily)
VEVGEPDFPQSPAQPFLIPDPREVVIAAHKPAMPIAKRLPGPGLLAHLIVSKCVGPLPLHRLERVYQRQGHFLHRSTLRDWMAACAQLLRPLYDLMVSVVLQSRALHTDDTTVKMQGLGTHRLSAARLWVYLGDAAHPYNVFDFTVNRKRDGPEQFLANYQGYLHADAFSGYDGLYLPDPRTAARIIEVACNAHARRKFKDIDIGSPGGKNHGVARPGDALPTAIPVEGMMDPESRVDDGGLERFRPYLLLLARLHLKGQAPAKLDASDVVQQALLEAHRKHAQFRGSTDAERAGWLRQLLACTLADARRALGRAKRDVARERSLDQELEQSSLRLGSWLAAAQVSPSEQAVRHEEAVGVAAALSQLPEANREAVALRYWEGLSLDEISARLGRTPAAVAGLLKRGLKQLRRILQDESQS